MSGRLKEIAFSELKEKHLSPQSSLTEYSGTEPTYIAVVSEPRGNIEDVADEVWTELGMPEWALKKFLARRAGYRSNSAISNAHNQAYVDMDLDSVYKRHLQKSNEAQARVLEAVERLTSGENITLVCYESSGEKCHRHLLIDKIADRVAERENCRFELHA
jgi:Protein of unknown function, DUF488.